MVVDDRNDRFSYHSDGRKKRHRRRVLLLVLHSDARVGRIGGEREALAVADVHRAAVCKNKSELVVFKARGQLARRIAHYARRIVRIGHYDH